MIGGIVFRDNKLLQVLEFRSIKHRNYFRQKSHLSTSEDPARHYNSFLKPGLPARLVQPVAIIWYACANKKLLSRIGAQLLQGLVSIFGGRLQLSNKTLLDLFLLPTYDAFCNVPCISTSKAMTGCIIFDGWNAALGAPILGVTWHFIDNDWRLRCIPIATMNIRDTLKNGNFLCTLIEAVMSNNLILGLDEIRLHIPTTDNEPATAFAVDLITNFVSSVRGIPHTLALSVNDVFQNCLQ